MRQSNAPALLEQLATIVGESHLLLEPEQTAAYLTEQRGRYKSECLAVVRPASTQQLSDCVKCCVAQHTAMVPIGGNTGLCGGAVAQADQIILSTERLNRIEPVDTTNYAITVGAGAILANIQHAASEQQRLFPLSLGAEGSCQIGGNLSTNAGGINVLHYGTARDLCLGIEAVLPDGSIFSDLGGLRKDNTGYSLKHLLIGAEGTLGIITAATLKLFPMPVESVTALVAVSNLNQVISLYEHMREASSDRITTFELIPQIAIEFTARHFPDQPPPFTETHPWQVLVIINSSRNEPELQTRISSALETAFEAGQISDALIAQNIAQARQFLALREKLVAAQKFEGASIKHDISVPISNIPAFISRSAIAVEKLAPGARPYPFGHVGDGNIHYNISQPEGTNSEAFFDKRDQINRAILDIVYDLHGSFSAEHGIGLLKTQLIPQYKGEVAAQAMRNIKRAIDSHNLMNPGKVVEV